ncbi:MAG TPA: hypothetical protein EYG51_23235, partial [Pseudomonadales bacterium]|nr:hypothetical protein [Pseudomonadales bacterium]
MNKISVAIPFYNNTAFLEDCLRIPLMDPRVDDIIINDDCSTQEEYGSLLEKVTAWSRGKKFNLDSCPRTGALYEEQTLIDVSDQVKKVRVERNSENMLSFRNKYETVSKAKNEWVYLLDSDNYLIDSSINALYNSEKWEENTLYMPNVLIMDRENENTTSWDDWNYRRFGYKLIELEEMKRLILESFQRPPTFGL